MDGAPRVRGTLEDGRVAVACGDAARDLEARGFGEADGGRLVLEPFEALYLLYTGRMELRRGRRRVGFGALLAECRAADPEALTRFLIYRDLRGRGYVVKDGFGFGSDFRVYERGHHGKKGARFLVFGLAEGRQERAGRMQRTVAEIVGMGKEPIVAVIERRGEVIYYRTSRMTFGPNRASPAVSTRTST